MISTGSVNIGTTELNSTMVRIAKDCSTMKPNEVKVFEVARITNWFYVFNLNLLLNLDKKLEGYFVVENVNEGVKITLKPV